MENPVPVQASEEIIQPSNNKKYLGISILAGILYGFPALLISFGFFFVLSFFLVDLIFSYFPKFNEMVNVDSQLLIMFSLSILIGVVVGIIAGAITGRTTYRRLQADGSIRPVGYSMLSCSGIGILGIFVFPILCYAGYYILSLIPADKGGYYIMGFLTGGTESAMAAILLLCVPSIGITLAYITAILFGGVVYRNLSRKRQDKMHTG
jgi:hypothetical protein